MTSATLRAPEAIAASTVRSVTALQWQTYIGLYAPTWVHVAVCVTWGTPDAIRSAAMDSGIGRVTGRRKPTPTTSARYVVPSWMRRTQSTLLKPVRPTTLPVGTAALLGRGAINTTQNVR